VKISGEATLDEVEDAIFESTVYKPALVLANKIDAIGSVANLERLRNYVRGKLPILGVSCEKNIGLEKLGETLFKMLNVIRVYTKEPSQKNFSKKPFILKKGATVYDLAKNIHSDFRENFAFAKVWAKRLVFSPQKVGVSFVLDDGDVAEIHVK
jgi:ribosome-interacting GTPase 1